MDLYIRVVNGQPFEHPIFGDNFRQAFPQIDTNNLPPEFARFERLPPPTLGVYEVYEGVTYERDGDVFKDVHRVRAMTNAEKVSKQKAVKERWKIIGSPSWVFDEETCRFLPPIPRPNDGQKYKWDEASTSWVLIQSP